MRRVISVRSSRNSHSRQPPASPASPVRCAGPRLYPTPPTRRNKARAACREETPGRIGAGTEASRLHPDRVARLDGSLDAAMWMRRRGCSRVPDREAGRSRRSPAPVDDIDDPAVDEARSSDDRATAPPVPTARPGRAPGRQRRGRAPPPRMRASAAAARTCTRRRGRGRADPERRRLDGQREIERDAEAHADGQPQNAPLALARDHLRRTSGPARIAGAIAPRPRRPPSPIARSAIAAFLGRAMQKINESGELARKSIGGLHFTARMGRAQAKPIGDTSPSPPAFDGFRSRSSHPTVHRPDASMRDHHHRAGSAARVSGVGRPGGCIATSSCAEDGSTTRPSCNSCRSDRRCPGRTGLRRPCRSGSICAAVRARRRHWRGCCRGRL